MRAPPTAATGVPWLIAGAAQPGGSGGRLRAAYLFRALGVRTAATMLESFGRRGLPPLVLATATRSHLWRSALHVASAQLIPTAGLWLLRGRVQARLLDLHDHPRMQLEAFGLSSRRGLELDELVRLNLRTFELISVPSASFAELCGLPPERVTIATNGTDPRIITPSPPAATPVVAMVSGAAPGRGIELLVEAMAEVRRELPETRLRLALAPTSPASRRYLAHLGRAFARLPWARFERVSYQALSTFLADAQVVVVPHPPHPYLDAATPVKLFDAMASGRPLVVTPRFETAQIVRRWGAGLVAGGDSMEDLAFAILRLLEDPALRNDLGTNGRRAAVEEFDWQLISSKLADDVLAGSAS